MSYFKKRLYFKTKVLDIVELKNLLNSTRLHYIKVIVLFGSRVGPNYSLQSDYDFAIMTDETFIISWGSIAQAWNDIGDILGLGDCDYDIVDLSQATDSMIHSIKENYILLKGEDDELQRLFDKYN